MDTKKRDIKILIADDEEDTLELMNYILMEEGFIIQTASDGKEAVEKTIRNKPDIIYKNAWDEWH